MENSNTYKKHDTDWLKVHECDQIKNYNGSLRADNGIEDEDYEKVFIAKELDGAVWELNLEVSDDEDYVTYESIEIRYCPYCSEALKEGIEEVPEDLKRIMRIE